MEIREIRPDEADELGDVRGRMETCTVLVAMEADRVGGGVAYVPGPVRGQAFGAPKHRGLATGSARSATPARRSEWPDGDEYVLTIHR